MKNIEEQIVIYQTEDGKTAIDVRLENETVWLSQAQMANLFQKDQSVIARHINNVFKEGELDKNSNMQILHNTFSKYKPTTIYSLDVIISVGYRVKSLQGVAFRRWANRVLKEYLIKGYVVNEKIRKKQIGELRQLVQMLGRTIQNQPLLKNDENQALFDIVVDYTYALDTLDDYDYQRLTMGATTQEEMFQATYDNAKQAIAALREKFGGSPSSATRRTALSKAPSGKSIKPSMVTTYIPAWKRRRPCCSIWSPRTTRSATATNASPPRCSSGSSTTTASSITKTAPSASLTIHLWP